MSELTTKGRHLGPLCLRCYGTVRNGQCPCDWRADPGSAPVRVDPRVQMVTLPDGQQVAIPRRRSVVGTTLLVLLTVFVIAPIILAVGCSVIYYTR